MDYEDIDEDFEYAGNCVVSGELLDMSEAGFCESCGGSFMWGVHGGWKNSKHCCANCGWTYGD